MSRTRHKLAEAQFFLKKIDEHYYDDIPEAFGKMDQPPVISFFLSAFVSSARSVTWIMRSEYGSTPGWNEWFASKHPDEGELDLLQTFNELRIRTQKIRPLVPAISAHVGEAQADQNPRMPRIKVSITPVSENPDEPIIFNGQITQVSWTLENRDGAELSAKCHEYLSRLTVLVSECEGVFGSE